MSTELLKQNDNQSNNDIDKETEIINDSSNEEIQGSDKKVAKEILLQLGDIILISDPNNEILNDNVFLIEYIDPNKLKLINSETFEKTILQISPNRVIGDGNIKSITVISSNPESGYAKQNDLLPGTWINIYFGGDIPTVITGKITNLEEDMIEIRTTDNDIIFINFAYQGIPEDLPIETFEIRPAIEEKNVPIELLDITEQQQEEEEEEEEDKQIPKKVVQEKIKRMFFDMDDIEFGDVIKVEEFITIDKDKYRFNIETQTNDLLEEMISNIPNYKRTNNVLNSIHIMITRFLQLRTISSTFDINKNITGIIKRTANDRPLADYLSEFKNSLYWIMMVVKNIKKIYPIEPTSEFKKYDDYETINLTEDLKEISSLYITTKSSQTDKTKYSSFTYQSFDKYMTPFYGINSESVNDAFVEPNGIIIEGNVESNINAIVDNLGDIYSTIVEKSELTNRRFIIQKYNLALQKLVATNFKGSKLVAHRVKVTDNDPISINSIITLPEPAVRFSQINLPGTNLLVRSNLNLHFLNYWQLLKQKTELTKITIDGLDNEIEYDDTNFVDNIKQYLLDLTEYEKPKEITNLDIYKIFLRTIIPKTRVLFSLVKKYIKGRLSLVDVVNYLEPFMIYPIDLTYMQYTEINSFIFNKIKEYNSKFKEYSMAFSSLRYTKIQDKKDTVFSNPLFELMTLNTQQNKLREEVIKKYGFELNKFTISGSNFLKNITLADYGNLYNTAVALSNVSLMFPSNLGEVLNKDNDHMKTIIENDKKLDKCSSYIIAKKYYSEEALISDNNKLIYYDKNYDTTNYNIIEEKYKKERDRLSKEDFYIYLINEFTSKMGEEAAEHIATTLINQAKQVKEGDYAILLSTINNDEEDPMANKLEYYVRYNDEWVLDDDVDPSTFIKEDDVLCNLDYSCIYNSTKKEEDKCESLELSKDTLVKNALKQIIDQFDSKYEISETELSSKLTTAYLHYLNTFDKIDNMKTRQFLKYNNYQYNLGLSVVDDIKDKIVSPYSKLRDLIMGQNDFIKKQSDIIQFVSLYCYEGNSSVPNINDGEMENIWWLYCKETNTKLLPKFHYMLASTFINNNSKYDDVLNNLKRTIGKRSDDGDAWVDEHSGEVICYIDLDVSEGYKEGFVDSSRDILEKDTGEVILEKQKEKRDKRLSPEGEIVSNVISILTTNMGIDIEESREFIVRVVTELMSDTKIIEKEPAYRKREEEVAKKGKKIPSYGTLYSSTILYLTLGTYLIAIQTSIPPIRTRKTAPGCIRSFVGFPFEGEGDDSSVNYVACVALKSRDSSTIPWNILPKSQEKIVTTLKSFIIRYLLPNAEIENKIKEKTEYLLVNPQEFIPEEHDLSKWVNFLPPLKKFHVNNLDNVSDGFIDKLHDELKTGNYKQLEKLLIIDSKIIAFSLAIQEAIQKLVEKKDLLLKSAGQLFMDNACCNESSNKNITSLQYFINNDKNIELYNNIVSSLTSVVYDIKILTQSAIMLSDINTKRTFSVLSNDFSEETIYHAFVTLCKFQSSIPLSEELTTICIDKPLYLKKMDSIQEKITKLKRDGRNYTKEQFLRLFQIVSRNNIIKISLNSKNIQCVDNLTNLLVRFDDENNENIPKVFIQKLEKLLDTYDTMREEDTKEMRNLKDYLQISIDKMRTELLDFIKIKAKVSSSELRNLTKFIQNISVWSFDETPRNVDLKISDDGLYNYVNFIKNYIELFVIIFPSMILNQRIQTIEPPKYWGLAKNHANEVKEMVSNFYKPIEKFYGNSSIKNVLNEVMSKSRGIYLLSQNTPVLTNIKIGNKEIYNSFDKRITMLLYEYYLLNVLTDYIYLTKDPSMVTRILIDNDTDKSDLFSADFLIEQQLKFTELEQEFIEGDVMKLNQEVAKLITSYLTIMMRSKKTINLSYQDIQDKVFKLKEAEKYDFTDKLRDMTDDQRAVDTILKHHKLGPLYSLGMSKGIKEYDPEHFEHDKQIAENVIKIQNKLKKKGALGDDVDLDMDDAIDEMNVDREIDEDLAMDVNSTDDYDDGDPWGDETDNAGDYY